MLMPAGREVKFGTLTIASALDACLLETVTLSNGLPLAAGKVSVPEALL
jgi:hypothetical protein